MANQELVIYSGIQEYPFLTPDEFELACHYLDNRYLHATLGQARRRFKLHIHRLMTGETPYIVITTPITVPEDNIHELLNFGALSTGDQDVDIDIDGAQTMDIEAEDADMEALRPGQRGQDLEDGPFVQYEIHRHPTYRMPVLWFSLRNLPGEDSVFDIESVYRYLVPDVLKAQLRSVGVMGGISAANHPVTQLPCFFLHPCNTKEAMEPFGANLSDYLMIWLGIVGFHVGLKIPLSMA